MTPKQARFAAEYIVDLNASQAALRAGYSKKTAHSQGSRLLQNAEVQAEIQRQMARREAKTAITQERVLQEIACFAFGDIRRIFDDETGALKHPSQWSREAAASIASVEVVTRKAPGPGDGEDAEVEYVHKIKMVDKKGGLELLGKHLAMFTDRTEHSGGLSIEVVDNSDAFGEGGDG